MPSSDRRTYIAFRGPALVAEGDRATLVHGIFREGGDRRQGALLIYDATTSESLELDLRGTEDEALARVMEASVRREGGRADADSSPARDADEARADAAPAERRGPGRPRLGVVARELTLLPRHWDWLNAQPGGASAAVRRLVDQARAAGPSLRDARRIALESAYRFISAMAGDEARFEDATRALFALDASAFDDATSDWPSGIRAHALRLATAAFALR